MAVKTKPNILVLIISVLGVGGFAWMAWLVSYEKVANFDKVIITFVQGFETLWLTRVMTFFTYIGDKIQVIIISVVVAIVLWLMVRFRRGLFLFIGASLGSVILNEVLKVVFARERPMLYRLADATGYSFPSGHAMAALTLYGVLTYLIWSHVSSAVGRGIILLLSIAIILTIGISRIYLGVHYPSDIVAGYLLSGGWLALSIWLYERWFAKFTYQFSS